MLILIIILALLLLVIIRAQYENKHFKITSYDIETDKIPATNCYKYILITDLHNNKYGKHNIKLINKIKEIKPDALLIAGDMIATRTNANYDNAIILLSSISKEIPVYYSYGNHESKALDNEERYGDFYECYKMELDETNTVVLQNDSTRINEFINVYGLEIDLKLYENTKDGVLEDNYMENLIGLPDNDKYNILLAHTPKYFYSYCNWKPDLILSGHNHGGIIKLPLIGGIISPDFQLFPRFDSGLFTNFNTTMILSSGMGTHTIKFRLFNKPELVVVNINGIK